MVDTTPARPTGERHRELSRLAAILSRSTGSVIIGKHKRRVKTGDTAMRWYTKQRTRESLTAALFLVSGACSAANITELLALRWITLKQIQLFLKYTPLNDNVRAVIEVAVRREEQRLEVQRLERERKAEAATAFSSGLDITGQLQRILDGDPVGDPAPTPTNGEPEHYRRTRVSAYA